MDAKKKTLSASEQDAGARVVWQEQMADVPAERLVFVDETGTHTRMTPAYAMAPRGQRAYGTVPRNHTHTTTLICALTLGGLQAPMVIEGAMNREALVAWIGWGLAPTLVPGQIVVMDNLNVHLGPLVVFVGEVVRNRGRAGIKVVHLAAAVVQPSPTTGRKDVTTDGTQHRAFIVQAGQEYPADRHRTGPQPYHRVPGLA